MSHVYDSDDPNTPQVIPSGAAIRFKQARDRSDRVARDGERIRLPMMLMDGDTVANHQPGYRHGDGREAAARAWLERQKLIADAWRNPSPLPPTADSPEIRRNDQHAGDRSQVADVEGAWQAKQARTRDAWKSAA